MHIIFTIRRIVEYIGIELIADKLFAEGVGCVEVGKYLNNYKIPLLRLRIGGFIYRVRVFCSLLEAGSVGLSDGFRFRVERSTGSGRLKRFALPSFRPSSTSWVP